MTRSLAAAMSRIRPVTVVASGPERETVADGAFDLVGAATNESWRLPSGLPSQPAVVVDEVLAQWPRCVPDRQPGRPCCSSLRPCVVIRPGAGSPPPAAVTVRSTWACMCPVNRLAEEHRHHGFGFVGYQLVLLGDVDGVSDEPPRAVQALGASFPDDDVIVVGNGQARAWRGSFCAGRSPWIREWISGACSLTRSLSSTWLPGFRSLVSASSRFVSVLRSWSGLVIGCNRARTVDGRAVFDDVEGLITATSRLRRASERVAYVCAGPALCRRAVWATGRARRALGRPRGRGHEGSPTPGPGSADRFVRSGRSTTHLHCSRGATSPRYDDGHHTPSLEPGLQEIGRDGRFLAVGRWR